MLTMAKQLTSCKGLNCLVTGASSGIGRLLSLALAKDGARMALVARRADELNTLKSEIEAAGGEAMVFTCDVSALEQVKSTCIKIANDFGQVDMLVNNAGYGRHRPFLEHEIADQVRMMQVNYFGMMYFTKMIAPQMVERKKGWIVFVSSVAGKIATQICHNRAGGSLIHRAGR
jgi:short-subunit dehydrogenase